jgi:hypothetical protein
MASQANTIDLGELQDKLEAAQKRLKIVTANKKRAYDAYARSISVVSRATTEYEIAKEVVRQAVDAVTL